MYTAGNVEEGNWLVGMHWLSFLANVGFFCLGILWFRKRPLWASIATISAPILTYLVWIGAYDFYDDILNCAPRCGGVAVPLPF